LVLAEKLQGMRCWVKIVELQARDGTDMGLNSH
jgi:hypothetical protein